MRICNVCKTPIVGLDFNGRCEDCFAETFSGLGVRPGVSLRDIVRTGQAMTPSGEIIQRSHPTWVNGNCGENP